MEHQVHEIQHKIAEHTQTVAVFDSELKQMISHSAVLISYQITAILMVDTEIVKYIVIILSGVLLSSMVYNYFIQTLLQRKHLIARTLFEIIAALIFTINQLFQYLVVAVIGAKITQYLQLLGFQVNSIMVYLLLLLMYLIIVKIIRNQFSDIIKNRLVKVFKMH